MIQDYNSYIQIHADGRQATITIEKEISLNNADYLKASLEKILNAVDTLYIKLSNIELMDIAAIQLLHAFMEKAKTDHKKISYEISCSDSMSQLLLKAGFGKYAENKTV